MAKFIFIKELLKLVDDMFILLEFIIKLIIDIIGYFTLHKGFVSVDVGVKLVPLCINGMEDVIYLSLETTYLIFAGVFGFKFGVLLRNDAFIGF